jgi:hypothetical protein
VEYSSEMVIENFSETRKDQEACRTPNFYQSTEICKQEPNTQKDCMFRSNDKMNSILYNMYVNTYKFNVDCRLSESSDCYRVVRKARMAQRVKKCTINRTFLPFLLMYVGGGF